MLTRMLVILIVATGLVEAQGSTSKVKTVDGQTIQGRVSGRIAFDMGFGTGGVLIAGEDIERIDEEGVQVKVGASVLSTILPLSNRYTMMKTPPHALILENAVAKAPSGPGRIAVSFQVPCSSFADTGCENVAVDMNVIAGNQTAPKLTIDRILGEFRLENGKGIIVPALTITGFDAKPRSVKIGDIVPMPKMQK